MKFFQKNKKLKINFNQLLILKFNFNEIYII